jgi:hypothetical protein
MHTVHDMCTVYILTYTAVYNMNVYLHTCMHTFAPALLQYIHMYIYDI